MNADLKVLPQKDSAKLAEICKKLGIEIKTERVWVRGRLKGKYADNIWHLEYEKKVCLDIFDWFPAPDSEELLEIMPARIKINQVEYYLDFFKVKKDFCLDYCDCNGRSANMGRGKSLSGIFFLLLIWLAEKGLMGK